MDCENRGYKRGYFWQKWGGFRIFGSGHTVLNSELESQLRWVSSLNLSKFEKHRQKYRIQQYLWHPSNYRRLLIIKINQCLNSDLPSNRSSDLKIRNQKRQIKVISEQSKSTNVEYRGKQFNKTRKQRGNFSENLAYSIFRIFLGLLSSKNVTFHFKKKLENFPRRT